MSAANEVIAQATQPSVTLQLDCGGRTQVWKAENYELLASKLLESQRAATEHIHKLEAENKILRQELRRSRILLGLVRPRSDAGALSLANEGRVKQ